jgi:hypothetical protein
MRTTFVKTNYFSSNSLSTGLPQLTKDFCYIDNYLMFQYCRYVHESGVGL